MKMIKIKLIKSLIGVPKSHKLTVQGLGLRRIGHIVSLPSTPSILGMIKKVSYMVEVQA